MDLEEVGKTVRSSGALGRAVSGTMLLDEPKSDDSTVRFDIFEWSTSKQQKLTETETENK